MKIVDLIGKKFGRLTVVALDGSSRGGSKVWECVCDCGNKALITTRHLNRKNCNIRSCGCISKERIGENHPDWKGFGCISGLFWNQHIIQSAKGKGRKLGELSLTITKEYAWELYLKQEGKCNLSGLDITFPVKYNDNSWTASLDRIDSSKGYDPGNVQWVHKHINIMKNMYSQEHFIALCNAVASNCPIK